MEEELFAFEENEMVSHPTHYTDGFTCKDMECIDISRHLSFNCGNAFKYVWRAGKKENNEIMQDLEKAMWYLKDIVVNKTKRNSSYTAKCLFNLIIPEESDRYEVLSKIVGEEFDNAYNLLMNWHERLESGDVE